MKYLGICILLIAAISISYITGVGHGSHHVKPRCGVPVHREFTGTVEHTVFHGSRGERVAMNDIVFRRGAVGGALYSSFVFENHGYIVTMFYPDTVCLESP